jgi:integrase
VSAGIRRRIGRGRGSAPLLLDDLRRVVGAINAALATLDNDDSARLRLLRDRALILIGWSAALRRSELSALRASDIRQRGADLVVHVARSKTDQDGEGADIILPAIGDDVLDPAAAWHAWRTAARIRGTTPAWRSITRWSRVTENAIQGQDVADIVQRWTRAAGVVGDITAHSLRSGFATSAALAGAGALDIRQVTRHQSDAMLQRYVRAAGNGSRRAVLAAFGR